MPDVSIPSQEAAQPKEEKYKIHWLTPYIAVITTLAFLYLWGEAAYTSVMTERADAQLGEYRQKTERFRKIKGNEKSAYERFSSDPSYKGNYDEWKGYADSQGDSLLAWTDRQLEGNARHFHNTTSNNAVAAGAVVIGGLAAAALAEGLNRNRYQKRNRKAAKASN